MNDDLSRAEERAFDALPREKNPPRHLEDRVVAALRERGTLPTPISVARGPKKQGGLRFWIPAAAAAAVAIFASGFAFGQLVGTSRGVDLAVRVGSQASATEAAARLERVGTKYIEALASLSQQVDSATPEVRDSVRMVAIRVLGQAAEEMALIAPEDPLAAAVLRGMNQRNRGTQPAAPSRNVVWY